MYEYGLINKASGERRIIFGYDRADAFRRTSLNSAEWYVDYSEYVD